MSGTRLTDIRIYPIKSTAGVRQTEALVQGRGLALDRRWMLVDDRGVFITGREQPRLTLAACGIDEDGIRVNGPGLKPLFIPFDGNEPRRGQVHIWGNACPAVDCSEVASEWFSTLLGNRCRLVHMDAGSVRTVDPDYGKVGDEVSFADGYPLLLLAEASLADLNGRLVGPVQMANFRPNLVVDGCDAFAEDDWRRLRIGEVELDVVKACTRCVFTTVDPETGVKNASLEPLRTLSTYRRRPAGGVYFGQNLIPRSTGTIRVGDPVVVLG